MSALKRFALVAIAAGIVCAPRVLMACAVCTAGRDDESNAAFLVSTIFLSVLPLLALGTFVYVLWRRFQKLERAGTAGTPSAPAPGVAVTVEPSGARP